MNFWKSVSADEDAPSSSEAWSFGGLMKTLASKSESVIDTYRRDIEELSSGLLRETSIIRDAAARAVRDLPSSLDSGASVAQESLESMGQAIDDIGSTVWKSTSSLILGREDEQQQMHLDSSSIENRDVKYSRFDAQLRSMERDLDTYCSEPENKRDYDDWRLNNWIFDDERKDEIGRVLRENENVREAYGEAVPSRVDYETFWRRYFYHLERLTKAEEARALLVRKATSSDGADEEIGWDVEEEEESNANKESAINSESGKNSDVSIVSIPSIVEDGGWDEVEYRGSNDEGKCEERTRSIRDGLQKHLSVAEEESDLTWDIEDDE